MARSKPFQCHKCGTLYTGGRCPKCYPARVRGATVFTVCPPSWGWNWFTLDAAQLAELADALEA